MYRLINRQLNIMDFALSSLFRRKGKNLSLLVIYTLIVAVIASLIFFVEALKQEASELLRHAPDMVVQRMMAGRHELLPETYVAKIASIRGVRQVMPRQWGYYYDPVYHANYTLHASVTRRLLPGNIVVGQSVARIQHVEAGDILPLRTASNSPLLLTVEQILPGEAELVAADMILMAPENFREMFNFPADQATDLAVMVANPAELATVAAKIVAQLPDTRPILKSDMQRTYDSVFDWRGGMMIVVLSSALLSFIIFAWDKATGLSREERREIGILKAIGWETGDLLLLKFWEGVVISMTAYLCGVLLAYAHITFFDAGLFSAALKGWSVLYPQLRLTPVIDIYQLGILFCLSVFPYTVATIIPSWLSATVDPDAVMR